MMSCAFPFRVLSLCQSTNNVRRFSIAFGTMTDARKLVDFRGSLFWECFPDHGNEWTYGIYSIKKIFAELRPSLFAYEARRLRSLDRPSFSVNNK